jgi:hypothetical protein
VVTYDKIKNFGENGKNTYGPVITNRVIFVFSENRGNLCLLPQVRKSILRQAEIKKQTRQQAQTFQNNCL